MPRSPNLALYAPQWWQDSSSGLWMPTTLQPAAVGVADARPFPAELRPRAQAVAVQRHLPSYLDQVAVVVDEPAVGVPVSTIAEIKALASTLPFPTAIRGVARLTAATWARSRNPDAQLALAQEVFGDSPVFARIRTFLAAEAPHGRVFAEQNLMVLQRLLIEHAQPGEIGIELTPTEIANWNHLLLAVTAINGELSEAAIRETPSLNEWLPFFIQNGAYYVKTHPIGEIARAQDMFARIASETETRASSSHWCPIDRWMAEDYGLTIQEQLALGFGLAAMTEAWTEDETAGARGHISVDRLDDFLIKLGWEDRRDRAIGVIAADRETFQREFAASGDSLVSLAWENLPFLRHPFLLLDDGGLLLLSPRALLSWLGEGFHYRLLDAAQHRNPERRNRRVSRAYTAFSGELLETYALELVRSAYPGKRPVGGGRVYGEQPYGRISRKGKASEKTSDIAIDLGLDLVLVEVCASRLRAEALLTGEMDAIVGDLDRLLIEKIRQLDHCIHALQRGRAELPAGAPEVELRRIERIWPIVVTGSKLTQTPPLWDHIRQETAGTLQQAKVQPLTILGVEDLEALCAFVEHGYALHEILARKTQPPYQEMELAAWVQADRSSPRPDQARPSYVETSWKEAMERVSEMLDMSKGAAEAA